MLARGPVSGAPLVLAKLQQKKLILSVFSFAALQRLAPSPPLAKTVEVKKLKVKKEGEGTLSRLKKGHFPDCVGKRFPIGLGNGLSVSYCSSKASSIFRLTAFKTVSSVTSNLSSNL